MVRFALADWRWSLLRWGLLGPEEFDHANDAEDESENDGNSADAEGAQPFAEHGEDGGGGNI